MKLFTLVLSFFFATSLIAQECPVIESATINIVSPGNYELNIEYTASGRKHMNVSIYCGPALPANLIDTRCITVNGDGSASVPFACIGQDPSAVIVTATGNCGGGTTCSTLNVGPGGPTPLKMTSFYLKRINNKVLLNWQTANEIDVKEFLIQKKVNNEFVTVKTIAASNNINGSTYSFNDDNSSRNTSQYRLKIVDFSGVYSYSEIRAVKGAGVATDFNVYPNPSSGNASVRITDVSEAMELQVVDQAGRVVNIINLSNKNTVELNNLQKGMYTLRLINKVTGETTSRKLSVAN